ncbi:conserved hypothetical protein [Histoplasma capsulatum H143]|uniref:WIBG Mago-binding domain-containing protein n=1 Tax=Ajellomyces capsulatus (strain H143) TaxID=544712 RepID=C6HDQ9_AJECH|nr:conserved hypothetical protein [Histoplasma capsulatum H143]
MPPKSESEPISSSGITVNALTGERHIPASTRADGSQRREIKIRPGYRPPEDIQVYKNRTAEAWKNRGKGGIPGAEGLGEESARSAAATAASNKNAKKREAKRRAKAVEGENDLPTTSGKVEGGAPGKAKEKENWRERKEEENPGADADVVHDAEVEKEKKLRNLRKKLRQARELGRGKTLWYMMDLLRDDIQTMVRGEKKEGGFVTSIIISFEVAHSNGVTEASCDGYVD